MDGRTTCIDDGPGNHRRAGPVERRAVPGRRPDRIRVGERAELACAHHTARRAVAGDPAPVRRRRHA